MTSTTDTAFDEDAAREVRARVGTYLEGDHEGRGRRVALACARFNGGVTLRLVQGALARLDEAGVDRADVTLAWAPGAFELPVLARALIASSRRVDAVVALGAVIRGETGHYDFVAGECARGLQEVQLATGVPVVFGVLTTETVDQALERSAPDETNKGAEAVTTALEMASLLTLIGAERHS